MDASLLFCYFKVNAFKIVQKFLREKDKGLE